MLDGLMRILRIINGAARDSFMKLAPWIFFLLGLGLILVAHFSVTPENHPSWHNSLMSTGSLLLSAGVFSILLKSYQFINVFREELMEIFGDKAFSTLVQDAMHCQNVKVAAIPEVSEAVIDRILSPHSPALAKEIAKKAGEACKNAVLDYYVSSHERKITVESYNANTREIEFKDDLDVTLVPMYKSDTITYPSSIAGDTKVFPQYLTVDGENKLDSIQQENGLNRYSLLLTGKGQYAIRRSYIRRYDLSKDPLLRIRFHRYNTRFDVKIENKIPGLIQIHIFPSGFSPNEWHFGDNAQNGGTGRLISATKMGLTPPEHGYIIAIYPLR